MKRRTFKPGQKVMVTRSIPSYYKGWDNSWQPDMDSSVGKVRTVISDDGDRGVQLDDAWGYNYPHCCLKLVRPTSREDVIATLTIHGAAIMTELGRTKVARWLEEKARDLVNEGESYSKIVTLSYRIPRKKK